MIKKFSIVSILLLIFLGSFINTSIAHEGAPFRIFIVNRYIPGGLLLLSANVSLKEKKVILDYNTSNVKTVYADIKIGEIIGDMEDVNVLGTYKLKCVDISDFKPQYQTTSFSIPRIKRGITLAVWLDKVSWDKSINSLMKNQVLEAVKIISLEDDRIGCVGAYKGTRELINETGKNFLE